MTPTTAPPAQPAVLTLPRPQLDATDRAIFDAVREAILARGLDGVTLTEVARAAGTSRMTVYRRWESLERLVIAVTDLAARDCLEGALQAGRGAAGRDYLLDVTLRTIELMNKNAILQAALTDPSDILRVYLQSRTGQFQADALEVLREVVERGFADGSIPVRAPEPLCQTLLITIQAFVYSRALLDAQMERAQIYQELQLMLTAYLGAHHD